MSVRQNILDNINEKVSDAFYYKASDIEKLLFELKSMTDDEGLKDRLDKMILDLNSIQMDGYKLLGGQINNEEDN